MISSVGNLVGKKAEPVDDEINNKVERTWGDIPDLNITGESLGHL